MGVIEDEDLNTEATELDEDGFDLEITEGEDSEDESGEGDESEEDSGDPDPNAKATPEELAKFKAEDEDEAKAKAEADEKAARKAVRDVENEIALTSFKTEVELALASDERDTATGEMPTVLLGLVGTAYGKFASKAGQKAALDWLNMQMQERMMEAPADPSKFLEARSYLDLSNHCKSIGQVKDKIVREPVDPTEAHVKFVASLLLAPNFVPVGEGVSEDWQDRARALVGELTEQAGTYLTWMREQAALTDAQRTEQGEANGEPKVDEVVKRAAKIATGRTAGTPAARKPRTNTGAPAAPRQPYTGTRRDIGAHIASAFAEVPVGGFLTVGEIVKHVSDQYGEGDRPSQGAVAARLFPKSGNCTIEGIRPEGGEAGRSHKGAVKVS
jgi:hypothetical protein